MKRFIMTALVFVGVIANADSFHYSGYVTSSGYISVNGYYNFGSVGGGYYGGGYNYTRTNEDLKKSLKELDDIYFNYSSKLGCIRFVADKLLRCYVTKKELKEFSKEEKNKKLVEIMQEYSSREKVLRSSLNDFYNNVNDVKKISKGFEQSIQQFKQIREELNKDIEKLNYCKKEIERMLKKTDNEIVLNDKMIKRLKKYEFILTKEYTEVLNEVY